MRTNLARLSPTPPLKGRARLPDPWKTTLALAACMALQMTSLVMTLPLFARRLSGFGAGVDALGLSALGYALAATLAAPFMGALADRLGRRPVVLGSLGAYALAFTGYLLIESAEAFILVRGLAGGFTAGFIPAVLGTVGDIAPADRRAQYVGIVNGGASIGWFVGPVLGGAMYDRWGYVAPFGASAGMAALTTVAAFFALPETHREPEPPPHETRTDTAKHPRGAAWLAPSEWLSYAVLLTIVFGVMFAWTFIEPQLMFYAYDDLGWSSSLVGGLISTYGLAVMVGEFALGRSSDRWGRRPILVLGLVLFSAQFAGLVWSTSPIGVGACFLVAGVGNALFDPALSATFLELAPPARRGRVMGMRSAANSLGSLLGPALVVALTPALAPRGIFTIALLLVLGLTAVVVLIRPADSGRRSRQGERGKSRGWAGRRAEEDHVGVSQGPQ